MTTADVTIKTIGGTETLHLSDGLFGQPPQLSAR